MLAVAGELAKQAKDELPEIRPGERILREWLDNGVYHRRTALGEEQFESRYDFRQKKSSRVAVGGNDIV
ncbi:MAG: hypothetical protein IJ711_00345 [Lachnospiraceae bacterium]|nr:hypothetical protein [Lachnospiraceae bacterium]